MAKVAVIYHSGTGHTKVVAESIVEGARSIEGIDCVLLEVRADQIEKGRWNDDAMLAELASADAIVFGCPTWMGSVTSVFKSFLEKAFDVWLVQGWKDKVGAAFTNSASQSGDKLSTLMQLAIFGMQMNMLWVGVGDPPGNNWSGGSVDDNNRLGSWLGAMAQSNGDQPAGGAPSNGDHLTALRLGTRVASVTRQWVGEGKHITERTKAR